MAIDQQILIIASTNLVNVTNLRNVATGLNPTDAVVAGTLLDQGVEVTGAVNLPLVYQDAVPGVIDAGYRGTIPATVNLVAGAPYVFRVTATATGGEVRRFDIPCIAAVS
jgi:hypothetical protein